MSNFYRIYSYPMATGRRFKHIQFKRRRGNGERKSRGEHERDTKFDTSLSRTRRLVRDYILCNAFDYFCTFTFSSEKVDRFDYLACKKKITNLFKNYRQRYSPNFQYLLIPEFHEDGAIHFHGMIKGIREQDFVVPDFVPKRNVFTDELELVSNTRGYVSWSYYSSKLGHFNCSKIRHYEACATYVSKYITKDLERMGKGQRLLLKSSNLRSPELIFDQDDTYFPYWVKADFQNENVEIKYDSGQLTYLYVPDWIADGDGCSELRNPYEELSEEQIFIPFTGDQLKLEGFGYGSALRCFASEYDAV